MVGALIRSPGRRLVDAAPGGLPCSRHWRRSASANRHTTRPLVSVSDTAGTNPTARPTAAASAVVASGRSLAGATSSTSCVDRGLGRAARAAASAAFSRRANTSATATGNAGTRIPTTAPWCSVRRTPNAMPWASAVLTIPAGVCRIAPIPRATISNAATWMARTAAPAFVVSPDRPVSGPRGASGCRTHDGRALEAPSPYAARFMAPGIETGHCFALSRLRRNPAAA